MRHSRIFDRTLLTCWETRNRDMKLGVYFLNRSITRGGGACAVGDPTCDARPPVPVLWSVFAKLAVLFWPSCLGWMLAESSIRGWASRGLFRQCRSFRSVRSVRPTSGTAAPVANRSDNGIGMEPEKRTLLVEPHRPSRDRDACRYMALAQNEMKFCTTNFRTSRKHGA